MRRFIYIALLTAFFSACARISLKSRVYVGEVVAVRAVEGEHFTRAKGAVSLTFLIVRISDGSNSERVRLIVTDIYTAARYGTVGDRISFRYSEHLPFSGELAFRDISEYAIIGKRANQSPEPTTPAVTPRAAARVAPAGVVAHL